jgi:AcrR family transcriptional regulator
MGETVFKSHRDRRREAIIDVARQVFFEEGYAAASMSGIAARLGGSKGTLYNYFRGKEELFEAQVVQGCLRFESDAFVLLDDAGPPEQVLAQFGERYLEKLYSDWAVQTYRIVVAEAVRSPELARIFYEAGPSVGLKRLEAYLTQAEARGLVRIDDRALAAGEFLTLCRGHQHFAHVLNIEPSLGGEQFKAQAERAAALFMKCYGV